MIPVGHFCENFQVAPCFVPINLGAGANTGDWFDMTAYERIVFIVETGAGTAAQDAVLTLQQATSNAGGGAKALTFTDIYEKTGADLHAIADYTRTTQTAAATFTTVGEDESQTIIEFQRSDLDDGFSHVQLSIPDTGAAAMIGMAIAMLYGPKTTTGDATDLASAIA